MGGMVSGRYRVVIMYIASKINVNFGEICTIQNLHESQLRLHSCIHKVCTQHRKGTTKTVPRATLSTQV